MLSLMTAVAMTACTGTADKGSSKEFNYMVDKFADLEILRYQVSGFESLSLRQKQLLYHLSEAALMGRDILFDQNGRYNLAIRRTLEVIYTDYTGDRENPEFKALETYLKRVWFSSDQYAKGSYRCCSQRYSTPFFSILYASRMPLHSCLSLSCICEGWKYASLSSSIAYTKVRQRSSWG